MLVKKDEFVSERTDDFQDSFIASIVHDLKNLMVPIVSRSELLMMPTLSEEKRQYLLKQLNVSCNTMMDALNKMVGICKDRANRGNYHFETFKLSIPLSEAIDILEESAETKSITIRNHVPQDLAVFADKDAILSVVVNLVGNAVKFTPKGGEISIDAEMSDDEVRVVIRDNGIGIDEERIADLLRNNHYYTTPGTNGESGTGLGLLLCDSKLRHNGSSLEFSNLRSGGAEFSFKLPCK